MMMNISRVLFCYLLLFFHWTSFNTDVVVVVFGKDVEVVVTGNLHSEGNENATKATSSSSTRSSSPAPSPTLAQDMCHPCVEEIKSLLEPENIIFDILPTQVDTLREIKFVPSTIRTTTTSHYSAGDCSEKEEVESKIEAAVVAAAAVEKEEEPKIVRTNIPLYLFQQPHRLSWRELPFELVLVSDLSDTIPYEVVVVDERRSIDSWFPGYFWSLLLVCDCSSHSYQHIGWKFTKIIPTTNRNDDYDETLPLHFFALIVRMEEEMDNNNNNNNMDLFDDTNSCPLRIHGFHAPGWMLSELTKSKNNTTTTTETTVTTPGRIRTRTFVQ